LMNRSAIPERREQQPQASIRANSAGTGCTCTYSWYRVLD
jgi:hypothetical protein